MNIHKTMGSYFDENKKIITMRFMGNLDEVSFALKSINEWVGLCY